MSANERFFLKKSYLFWFFILVVLLLIFFKINYVLLPFYVAIFTTILFSGLVDKCEKKFHISRSICSAIITLLFCFFIISCLYALFNISFTKASHSVVKIKNNKDFIEQAIVIVGDLLKKFDIENTFNFFARQFSDSIVEYISLIVTNVVGYSANIIGIVFLFILSPIIMFMMLKDAPLIYKNIYLLLPKGLQKETAKLISEMHESVFKYIEGQTITALVLSVCYFLILLLIGAKHFIILGVLIGFSSFVPYIGFYSSMAITLFSVYNQFQDFKRMLITLFLLLVMQLIDSSFITPKIVGEKLGVHPLFVIFGVLVSVPLFGFIGVLLALPIIGIIGVMAKFLVKKYKNSSYYNNN